MRLEILKKIDERWSKHCCLNENSKWSEKEKGTLLCHVTKLLGNGGFGHLWVTHGNAQGIQHVSFLNAEAYFIFYFHI